MISFIDKWYEKLRPYIFKYKDGFFELPYLGNTPLLMIESFRRMPFIKHNDDKKQIISKSPFVDAIVNYHTLEDDVILMHSILYIKSNVCFRSTYKKEIPNGYYCLTYSTNIDYNNSSKRIINGEALEHSTFQLLKPSVKIKTYHFKDANFETIQVYFQEKWMINFLNKSKNENQKLIEFMNSKNDSFITSISDNSILIQLTLDIKNHFELDYNQRDNSYLQNKIKDFIFFYIQNSFNQSTSSRYYMISNNDRLKISKVEQILLDNITSKFPGIETISQQIGFSETKLKYLFKQLHQKTLLEYYQDKKMQAAHKLLIEGNMKVAEVAFHFGYTNVSKFSAMFKTHMNSLPSEVSHQNL